MAEKQRMLTKSGKQELVDELKWRENEERPRIGEMLKEARAQGDLSENAEYDSAKEAQEKNEHRIEELNDILNNSVVMDDEDYEDDEVGLGRTINIKDVKTGAVRTISIVGSSQANSREGRISNECPVGAALIHHKVGEVVKIELPRGEANYEIVSIVKTSKD